MGMPRQPQPKREEAHAPTLCQMCTSGAEARYLTAGAWMCEKCYHEHKPMSRLDAMRDRVMRENEEQWSRRDGESDRAYGKRMAKLGRELAARSGVKRAPYLEER